MISARALTTGNPVPAQIDRVRALVRIRNAYTELLAAAGELEAIDRALKRSGAIPAQTINKALVRGLLEPDMQRIFGERQ